jgi:N-acetylglucosamine malate deacetylase 1
VDYLKDWRALVLAPHTDDGEFGCGATIARLIEEGAHVSYVAFSAAEESVPEHLPSDILRTEVADATGVLGIDAENLQVLQYRVRRFGEHRQSILDDMIDLRRRVEPTHVFLPSTTDIHQDHSVISREGFRAFKHATVLGYELPWNNPTFTSSALLQVPERCVDLKCRAISMYRSQAHRPYSAPEFIRGLALSRGVQLGGGVAEAFEVIRWRIG